nr:signal peptidase I [Deinobacterium chartae]
MRRFFREWILQAALPLWLLVTFLVIPAAVQGRSMEPSLEPEDRLIILKAERWLNAWGLDPAWPRYGDIVVFKAPSDSEYAFETGPFGLRYRPYLIKRLVGRPGDRIELREGTLYRNGQPVPEPYATPDASSFDVEPLTLGPGQYYLLGDNRRVGESVDSRYFGPVRRQDLAGTVVLRFWPPGGFGRPPGP